MSATQTQQVLIVGPGRVGLALARAHRAAGDAVHLHGRSAGPWQAMAAAMGASPSLSGESAGPDPQTLAGPALEADLVLLTVPDDLLGEVSAQLAAHPGLRPSCVVHCSGLHGLAELEPWAAPGRCLAALHPVMPFPPIDEPSAAVREPLRGCPVTVLTRGDPGAALEVVRRWGAHPVPWQEGADRVRYHLGLCLAANHLTALLQQAESMLRPAVGDAARALTAGLAAAAVEAVATHGAEQALTGPVVRGDVHTLRAHLHALSADERRRYLADLVPVLDLARRSGRLSAERVAELGIQLGLDQEAT